MSQRQLPWYADGLRFSCTGCGDCCSGEPGAVWVNDDEMAQLAAQLELTIAAFSARYVRELDGRRALIERPGGDCVFLDETSRRCAVYAARPVQCKTWPFWPQNVGRRDAWQEVCEVCPGAGNGQLHALDTIERQLLDVTLARRSHKRMTER